MQLDQIESLNVPVAGVSPRRLERVAPDRAAQSTVTFGAWARRMVKVVAYAFGLVLVAIPAVIARIESRVSAREEWFIFWGQALSLIPGLPGKYLRKCYYRLTLSSCAMDCQIGFLSYFSNREAEVGERVYIGTGVVIGMVTLGEGSLIGNRASILNGGKQHRLGSDGRLTACDPRSLERVHIGEETWIGESAVLMADVGSRCIVSAGAVVSSAVPPGCIVAGNPARFVGKNEPSPPADCGDGDSIAPRRARPSRLASKLILCFMVTFLGLLIAEGILRLMCPPPPNPAREPQLLYEPHPQVGYLHVPNQKGWIDDGLVTINSLGLRGPEPSIPKRSGVFRIMVLGDSCTLGWGVHDDETFSAVLERQFQSSRQVVDVVNCGVSGYDTRHQERLLKHFGPMLQPDLILLGVYWNDLTFDMLDEDTHGEAAAADVSGFVVEPGSKNRRFHVGGAAPTWLNRTLRRSQTIYLLKHGLLGLKNAVGWVDPRVAFEAAILAGEETPPIEAAWKRFETTLAGMRSQAASLGCSLGVVALPCRAEVFENAGAPYQKRLRETAERVGSFVIDPLPRFVADRSKMDGLFVPYDRGHPGPAGHRVVAEVILESVQEQWGVGTGE